MINNAIMIRLDKLQLIWRILKFTGFHVALSITIIIFFSLNQIFGILGGAKTIHNMSDFRNNISVLIFSVTVLLFTVQNILRKVLGNEKFALMDFFQSGYSKYNEFPTQAEENLSKNPDIPKCLQYNHSEGFVFGRNKRIYACKPVNMDGHIGVFGGAGSGKSSCIVIPTLRAWNGPVFAVDIKGELVQAANRYRHNLKVFDAENPDGFGYDPFYFIDNTDNVNLAMTKIVNSLIIKDPSIKDPFWIDSTRNLLIGELLFLYHLGYSFIESMEFIQGKSQKDIIDAIVESDDTDANYFVKSFSGKTEGNTFNNIMMQLNTSIKIFATDKTIKAALSRNKIITPEDLYNGADVFIKIPEGNLEAWSPVLNLITSQFLKAFESRSCIDTNILMILDEFPRLGKVEGMVNAMATLRSRKITIALIVQSMAQFDLIYGSDSRKTLIDNMDFLAVLSATEQSTQRYFSDIVGSYKAQDMSYSHNSNGFDFGMETRKNQSYSIGEHQVIRPEEFKYLDEQLVMITKYGFFKLRKVPYYKAVKVKRKTR